MRTALAILLLSTICQAVPVDVYYIAGQSNATGYTTVASDLPAAMQAPRVGVPLHARSWGYGDLQPGSGGEFGAEMSFGHTLADAGYNVGIIKAGFPSIGLHEYFWPGSGSIYPEYLLAHVRAGLWSMEDAGYEPTLRGVLWVQGETDAYQGVTADTYASDLADLIAFCRADWGPVPWYVSRLSVNQTGLAVDDLLAIRAGQAAACDADPLTTMVDADNCTASVDQLHFDTAGQLSLGRAFATAVVPEPVSCLCVLVPFLIMRRRLRNG